MELEGGREVEGGGESGKGEAGERGGGKEGKRGGREVKR